MKKKKKIGTMIPAELNSALPIIEFTGNRNATVEGSLGILHYDDSVIRINLGKMVVSFCGRGLRLKCISPTAVVISGFITKTEFTV